MCASISRSGAVALIIAALVFAAPSWAFHSADTNPNWQIELSELLRVIQFFNSGGLGCAEDTEDGYAPGPGIQNCSAHDSDYAPADWQVTLSELLRLIQFFNSGGYVEEDGSEDGYAPIEMIEPEGDPEGMVSIEGSPGGEGASEGEPEGGISTEGAPEGEVPEIQHVIFFLLDALGAERMGTHGYSRDTTPFLDTLAGQGVVFEEAMATSSYTRESVASMFTGHYPSRQPYGAGWCASPDNTSPTLAEVFQSAGYTTAFFSASGMMTFPQFQRGWDVSQYLLEFSDSGGGTQLAEWAMNHLTAKVNEKTFTYIHYLDPHARFEPPENQYLKFADTVYPSPVTMNYVRNNRNELVAEGFGPGEARFDDFDLRHDAEIAWVDSQLGVLVSNLDAAGLLDNTLIVITSDHGEEFLEHGYVEHAWKLYYETQHVPLIFWAPDHFDASRVAGMVSTTDIRPTLLRLAGIDDPVQGLDGLPLFQRTAGAWEPQVQPRPIYAELSIQMRTMLRTVFFDDWQYIQAQQWLTPEDCPPIAAMQREIREEFEQGLRPLLDPWGPVVHEELYNLAADPASQNDLFPAAPPQLQEGRGLIDALHAASPEQVNDAEKCGWLELQEARAALATLATLGYLDAP